MMLPFHMDLYWPATQKLKMVDYLRDTADFLNDLGAIHPLLARWYVSGRNPEQVLRGDFLNDFDRCVKRLARSKNNTIAAQQRTFPFSFFFRSGVEYDRLIQIDTHRGSCGEGSDGLHIQLPSLNEATADLLTADTLTTILRLAAERWPLTWAHVTAGYYTLRTIDGYGYYGIGWMGYVPAILHPRDLPGAAELLHVGNRGTIIVTTREMFCAEDPLHLAHARGIEHELAARNLVMRCHRPTMDDVGSCC
jgi:hypothetical protein